MHFAGILPLRLDDSTVPGLMCNFSVKIFISTGGTKRFMVIFALDFLQSSLRCAVGANRDAWHAVQLMASLMLLFLLSMYTSAAMHVFADLSRMYSYSLSQGF